MVWCSFVALFAGEGRKGNFFFNRSCEFKNRVGGVSLLMSRD